LIEKKKRIGEDDYGLVESIKTLVISLIEKNSYFAGITFR